MKTERFNHIVMSNESVISIFLRIVVLLIAFNLIVTGYTQTEKTVLAEAGDVEDTALASQLEELLTTVYCYCGCTRETIKACVCGTALGIEANFRDALIQGKTVEEIRTAYLAQYGPQYYAVMPAEGINLIAYIMPAIILVFIGGVAFVVLQRSMRRTETTVDAHEKLDPHASDDSVKQVEAELERYKREN